MVVLLVGVLLSLDPTAFGQLNRNRNGASAHNVRLSTHQDRPDVGGVGVERENSVHKIEAFYSTRLQTDVIFFSIVWSEYLGDRSWLLFFCALDYSREAFRV
jgi:hypothetical protein